MSRINHISFSTRNPAKSRCGDASFAGEIELATGQKAILVMVADGVSRAPKDWLASKSTVELVVNALRQNPKSPPEALKEAIETANREVCGGIENTFGMLTTLVTILYLPANKTLYWASIGDSRIFGLKEDVWVQLSTDDSTRAPYKENGRVVLQNGVPVMVSLLTRAIGQDSGLDVVINQTPADDYRALALASDGFYDLAGFERYAGSLVNSADMGKTAQKIQTQIVSEIRDDASLGILCLPTSLSLDLRAYLLERGDTSAVPAGVLEILENDLRQSILTHDHEYLALLIQWMSTHSLFYTKPKMIELLELMIAHQNPLVHQMTSIIRRL